MNSRIEPSCVERLRRSLARCGLALAVEDSPRRVGLRAVNQGEPRLILQYSPGSVVEVRDALPKERLVLVELAERPGLESCVLAGQDESQLFALPLAERAPTVLAALESIVPAAVRRARAKGLKVLRQGDIWFVPVEPAQGGAIMGTRHSAERIEGTLEDPQPLTPWNGPVVSGWISHPEHAALHLDRPHWAFRNRFGD